jgi:hypothetical protein
LLYTRAIIGAPRWAQHGCLRDQVLFRAGGSQVISLAEIPMPVTLAQADVIAGRLGVS